MILRTASRFGGRYEWAQHIELGESAGDHPGRAGGARRGRGSARSTGRRSSEPRCDAVDETADAGAVSDATWDALAGTWARRELIELLMLIAHYLMLTTVLRSLRLPLEPRAEALAQSVPGGPAE